MNAIYTIVLLFAAPGEAPPAWVGAAEGFRGSDYVMQTVVGPEGTREECEKKLPATVRREVERYSGIWSTENGYGAAHPLVTSLTDEELLKRVVGEKWEQRVEGPDPIALHVQVKIDARMQDEWRRKAQDWNSERRAYILIAGFLLAMWAVAVVHVGLRVDGKIVGRTALRTRAARAVLWATAVFLTAIPVLVVS